MGSCCSDASHADNIFLNEKFADYKVTFSREQLEGVFNKYDADENDKLQVMELERMIKDMLDAVLKMQISQLSGKRSLRPLLRKFKKRIQAAKVDYKNQAKRLCDALDTDKNGTVSKAEFFKYIEELQKSRKEGIIGVLAAGDDGSLILTRAQYMKRKKEEGDLFGESAPEHKVGTKSSNPSNLARIVSEGNKSKRGHGGGILNESDAKAIKVEIDDTSLNLKNVAEIKEETKETKSENKQEETQATLIDAKAEEPRELGKEEREDPEPSTARESMIPGSSDRTQLNGDEANAR